MLNITRIPAPRVAIVDSETGIMSREWFRFFNNIYTIVGANLGVIQIENGGTGLSTLPTNGQLLIGDTTTGAYVLNTLSAALGVSVTNGAGTITIANTGVLSNAGGLGVSVSSATGDVTITNTGVLSTIAGTGISVSSATGDVTIANTGVLSFNAGTTGLTPNTATTGAVTLAGTLAIANGGTNSTATATAGGVGYGIGTAHAYTAVGTAGQVLTSAGVNVPTWTTPTTGTVTSVTGTAPVVSSGGTTPAISMAAATTSVNGYLTSTDWTTFNGKYSTGGALGTPSSGTVTNLTGTASININGTVGATTPTTGVFTTATANSFIPNLSTIPTNGMYLPAANSVGIATASTARVRIDASGNVGIATTPSAFRSSLVGFQVGYTGVIQAGASSEQVSLQSNSYGGPSVGVQNYVHTGSASQYIQGSGAHTWTTAASGSVDAAITFTTAMTLSSSSNLSVTGTISPRQATTAGAPAYVKGAIYFDTTLNKLRVGGATAWETITSV